MLIEFSVENYLCFKNETTFSFEAMADLDESKIFNPESRRVLDGVVDPETGEPITINTVNAIYGKNATGKSTILRAMLKVFDLIMNSQKLNEDDDFGIDYDNENQTPTFRLKFVQDKAVFDYSFCLKGIGSEAIVLFEKLYNVTTAKIVFERNQAGNITYGSEVFSEEDAHKYASLYAIATTKKNHLAFSNTSVSYFDLLRETFSKGRYMTIDVDGGFKSSFLTEFSLSLSKSFVKQILSHMYIKPQILKEIKQADFNIEDFYVSDEDKLFFVDKKGVHRSFSKQSDGTKKYFILLFLLYLNVLRNGGMYVVDELEKSLHPKLALRLIDIFKNPETNPKNARLLFTSHDVGFMHQSILNGDQVWFIDRNDETQETKLSSAADAEGFEPVYLQSDYMQGLYGAVPTIADDNK
jgi:AAA15 family ATPase/GTPase